jgi:flagellar protein FlgJ
MAINSIQSMVSASTGIPKSQVDEALNEEKVKGFESAIQSAVKAKDQEGLKKATEEFEAVFIQILLKSMRETITEGGLIEKSQGRSMFEGMYDEELSKNMAMGRQMGIADMLYQQLSQFDESDERKGFDVKG